MKRIFLILSSIVLILSNIHAQQESPDIRRGNRQYEKQDFTAAEVDYRRGLEKNANSFEGHYNLGNALFKQEKYPEALAEYQKATQLLDNQDDKQRIADSYHNLGNAFYTQQQYDKAVAAFQESLRHNPKDNDTRYNLVKSMQMLEKQQQQQQNQQNKDDQQQQQDQQQEQQNSGQQQEQQDAQEQQQEQQQAEQDEQTMDQETAEQILQALEQSEQETQEKLQRQQGQKRRVEKDW